MLITGCVLFLLIASLLAAQAGVAMSEGYDLSWNALFPGGATSGGAYTMDSAIGQPFAGKISGSSYELCSGFLCGANSGAKVYLPLVRK
jgi:hypothetical protein